MCTLCANCFHFHVEGRVLAVWTDRDALLPEVYRIPQLYWRRLFRFTGDRRKGMCMKRPNRPITGLKVVQEGFEFAGCEELVPPSCRKDDSLESVDVFL